MLESISWTKFLEAAAALGAIYYAGLALTSYREDAKVLLSRRPFDRNVKEPGMAAATTPVRQVLATPMGVIHELSLVLESKGRDTTKEELLTEVKAKLARYKNMQLPAWRVPVHDYLMAKAEEICGVRITAADLDSEG